MKNSALYALRWYLTALACCLIASGLALHQVWRYCTKNRTLYEQTLQHAVSTTRAIEQFQATETELRQNVARFLELKARNIISPKNSTHYPDIFSALQRDLHIAVLDHELSALAAGPSTEFPGAAGGYQVRASQLRLNMSLLHEAELMPVLHQLRERAPALLRLQECQLIPAPDANTVHRSPLLASCKLEWITFNKGV